MCQCLVRIAELQHVNSNWKKNGMVQKHMSEVQSTMVVLADTHRYTFSCSHSNPHTHHPSHTQVGEVVYARVSRAHRDSEPELSCVDPSGKANGLGPLPVSGYLFKCSIGLCRK